MNSLHSCQAIVVTCIDFRLQKYINDWIDKTIKGGFDRVAVAGGVKNLDFVLEQIEISHRLHNIKEVYLINHEDCGAYEKYGNFERHKKDLFTAMKKINQIFPTLNIFPYYLKLNGDFVKV